MKKLTVIPNSGARLGHQFSEWLRAYVFCKLNDYEFYHYKFLGNSEKYDEFLNLSYNENLFENYKGKVITKNNMNLNEYLLSEKEDLYLYDFRDKYFDFKITNDLLVKNDIRNILRNKYYNRNKKMNFNNTISVHIRRDDVTKNSEHFSSRYINIEFFINIIKSLYEKYPEFEVRIFSNKIDDDFLKIKEIPQSGVFLHIDDDLEKTINYMISSKILVTSKSGISFLSTLISDEENIKICPDKFWLKWPCECKIISDDEY